MHLSDVRDVLHVEDEILIALDVEATLLDAGVQTVVNVGSCSEAMDRIRKSPPAAVILDVEVRDGSTAGLAALLKSSGIPFIVYSGSDTAEAFRSFEGITFLEKPATSVELVAALQGSVATA